MKKEVNKMTWADLKKVVNELPEELLDQKIVLWPLEDGEEAWNMVEVMKLEENYVFDGDMGCTPESALRESYDEELSEDEFQKEHYLVFEKGTPIMVIQ